MGLKDVLRGLFAGYSHPSNRKSCERCDGVGSLFTQLGVEVESKGEVA